MSRARRPRSGRPGPRLEMNVARGPTDATSGTQRLTAMVAVVMTVQAILGLTLPGQYRDVEWIRATWYGNDWVTLIVAVPLLLVGRAWARGGSARGLLLWLGATAYAAYNYAFYLFGAALNAFFPLYVVSFVLAGVTLMIALPRVDADDVVSRFQPPMPAWVLGSYLVVVALGLAAIWIGTWASYVFFGRPTPVEPDVFRLVAALDLSAMVPLLACGGVMLWRRLAWGPVVSAIGGVHASLYLLVLSVNAILAIERGLVPSPGEFPLWGTLFAVTTIVSGLLLLSVREPR